MIWYDMIQFRAIDFKKCSTLWRCVFITNTAIDFSIHRFYETFCPVYASIHFRKLLRCHRQAVTWHVHTISSSLRNVTSLQIACSYCSCTFQFSSVQQLSAHPIDLKHLPRQAIEMCTAAARELPDDNGDVIDDTFSMWGNFNKRQEGD